MLGSVHGTDVLAAALVIGASVAFAFGAFALARSADITATYFMVVGFVAVRAAYAVVESREK
ncbi:hypothetical protein BH09MYX1_BH09MYX1_64760 [soil metagenome]